MKINQVILVLLGALSVEAIRMSVTKEGDDKDMKVPEDIVKDAASKGLLEKDSAAVANVAANVGQMQKKIEADQLARKEANEAKASEKSGIEIYAESQAEADKRVQARNKNQSIQAKLEGIDVMASNNRRLGEISEEATEAERLEKI